MSPRSGPGERFQDETKYERGKLPGGGLDWDARPAPYKTHSAAKRVMLPAPERKGGPPLWDVVRARRSERHFRGAAMPVADLSQLFWAIQGITGRAHGCELRAAPSAGALYPVETYVAAQNVEGLPSGIYHYDVRGHALETLREGDVREP
ncbi:MAG: SagB/ThcOx family dehydrogenase, partial [Candidatus Aminicenantes bacterium]|nr:SagB/ThcOx family dehydrogenase [Candidatus Aminicenantes bacterium]